jgi:hypothetical protein
MIKKITRLKRMLVLFFSLLIVATFAQCDNIGFESGTTTSWVCGSGTFGVSSPALCDTPVFPTVMTYDGNCLNEGGINGTGTPMNTAQNRHTIMNAGVDYNSQNTVPCVAPANLFPAGVNTYSFRLGNAVGALPQTSLPLAYAEAIKYTINVTPSNAGLTYLYAVFVKEAMPAHLTKEDGHFEVKITDANQQTIDCGNLTISPGSANLKNGFVDQYGTWKYSDWRKVALNLTKYIGQTLTLEFITTDCYPNSTPTTGATMCTYLPGSHSAYAYIDMYCAPVEISSPVVCANQSTVQICAPDGYATYYWPSGQPGIQPPYDQRCVTINNPKAGDAYTVNLTSVTGGCASSADLILKGADFIAADVQVCKDGGAAQLNVTPVTSGNYAFKWEPQVNLNQYTIPNPVFTPGQSTTYTVTMSDAIVSNCNAIKTVHVEVVEKIIVSASDIIIHRGETAPLNGSVSGGTGIWVGGMGTFAPDRSALNAVYTPTSAEETAGNVELILEATDAVGVCPKQSKTMIITILTPTGITTVNKDELSMEIYPNPFTTELTITVSGLSGHASAELKLVDFFGKELRSQKLTASQKMERSDLPAGMYFIELREQGRVLARKKIVINN